MWASRSACARRSRPPSQPRARRFLVDIAADGAHARDGADRRNGGEALADLRLDFGRHQIAAIRIGARRQRLDLKRAQTTRLARTDIGLEGRLVLQRGDIARGIALAADRRARRFQRDLVEPSRLRIDGPIDTREFFFQHGVAGAVVGKREPLVIGVLERLKGAHHLAMRHHGVERNARFGLKLCMGVDIHLRSPCGWMCLWVREHGKPRVASGYVRDMTVG